MKLAATITILVLLCIAGSPISAATPDFSGTWILDFARSDVGKNLAATGQAPRKIKLVIKQTATTISTERFVSEKPETAVHTLNGSECTNTVTGGRQVKSTTTWVGSTLVTKARMAEGNNPGGTTIRSLSPDGKTMTIEMIVQTPQGEKKQIAVYDRQ